MTRLLIKGGLVITPTEECMAELLVEDDKIVHMGGTAGEEFVEVDAGGCYVSPGLFDIQVNGGPECDFWAELTVDRLESFSRRLLQAGVTAILPTLITGEVSRLKKNRDFLKPLLGLGRKPEESSLMRFPGIHFEGPFLSPDKPGVHPVEHLKPLELPLLKELVDESCQLMTLAPELDPSGACLQYLKNHEVLCSIGHSNATFEQAHQSFENGIRLMTHTFNALPGVHHRQPGAVSAALLDKRVHCCVIPDGLHVLPPIIELIVRMKGIDRTVLVSDMAAVGTSGGGLVGSSLVLSQGVRNVVKWGICTFASAVRMASYNPARLLDVADCIGQIRPGAYADLILWDRETLEVKDVIFNGRLLSRA